MKPEGGGGANGIFTPWVCCQGGSSRILCFFLLLSLLSRVTTFESSATPVASSSLSPSLSLSSLSLPWSSKIALPLPLRFSERTIAFNFFFSSEVWFRRQNYHVCRVDFLLPYLGRDRRCRLLAKLPHVAKEAIGLHSRPDMSGHICLCMTAVRVFSLR